MKKIIALLCLMLAASMAQAQTKYIKILFVYAPSLVTSMGPGGVQDSIAASVNLMNQSFSLSGISNVRVQSKGYLQAKVEYPSNFASNDQMAKDYFVNYNRDAVHADLVFGVLNLTPDTECGRAYTILGIPSEAFASAPLTCIESQLALQHEIGHLVGFQHDIARDNSTVIFPNGHGNFLAKRYNATTSSPVTYACWHSIMSYPITPAVPNPTFPCNDAHINYWTGNVNFYGEPTGSVYNKSNEAYYWNNDPRIDVVTNWWQTPTSPAIAAKFIGSIIGIATE